MSDPLTLFFVLLQANLVKLHQYGNEVDITAEH